MRRTQLGISQAELARRAGVKTGTVQFIENGKTQNPMRLLDFARALECSPEWLKNGLEAVADPARPSEAKQIVSGDVSENDHVGIVPHGVMSADVSKLPLNLPIRQVARRSEDQGMFEIGEAVVGMMRRPPRLDYADKAFCIEVLTDTMGDALRLRSIQIVNPDHDAIEGDEALIEFKPGDGDDRGRCVLKRIVSLEADHITVTQLKPPSEERYLRSDILRVSRIVPWDEAMRG